ncbi:hypothetical protein JCM1840_002164 [Sporobolomyces johnsonii]
MAQTAAASLRLVDHSHPSSSSSEFIQFKATMRLPIAPVFASNGQNDPSHGDGGMDGVREVLAGWVMRYLPPLRAVVLSFSPSPRFLHPAAPFPADACPFDDLPSASSLKDPRAYLASPPADVRDNGEEKQQVVLLKTLPMIDGSGFTLANVEWEGLGWRPRVGMKLVGTPTLSTPSHISLLLHNLFNASIPASHIPSHLYEFDPECPVPSVVLERRKLGVKPAAAMGGLEEKARKSVREALGEEGDDEEDEDDDEKEDEEEKEEEDEEEAYAEKGWWVDKKTREPLGGKEGRVEFTLVGLATSNSLLSCTGSLLPDPFSPAALSSLKTPSASLPTSASTTTTALKTTQALRTGKKRLRFDDDDDDGSSSSDSEAGIADGGLDADDDDGVGTGVPRHQGAPSAAADSSDSDASSRSPSPEPVPVKKGKKTKAEKKGAPPAVQEDSRGKGKTVKKGKRSEGDRRSKKAKTE